MRILPAETGVVNADSQTSRRRAALVAAGLAAILIVAAILRLYRLNAAPIFVDEGAYALTCLQMKDLPVLAAIEHPATNCDKLPLPFLLQLATDCLVGNLVLSGRLIAALCGVLTTALCFPLGRRIAGPTGGLLTAALYAICPMAVLYERMNLHEGPMSTAALAAVVVAWSAIESGSVGRATLAAVLGGVAVQLKLLAVVMAPIPLALLVLLPGRWRDKWQPAAVAAAGPLVSYLLTRLSPLTVAVSALRAYHLRWFTSTWRNCVEMGGALPAYFPGGLLVILAGGLLLLAWRDWRKAALLGGSLLIWNLPWLLLAKADCTRYHMGTLPYVCALAAAPVAACFGKAGTMRYPARIVVGLLALAVLAPSAVKSVGLMVDRAQVRLSPSDQWLYQSAWPAGYGYIEAAEKVRQLAEPGSAVACLTMPFPRYALGLHRPGPPGVRMLGLFGQGRPLPSNPNGPLYVILDDWFDAVEPRTLAQLQARQAEWQVLATYVYPISHARVRVLRLPPSSQPARWPVPSP